MCGWEVIVYTCGHKDKGYTTSDHQCNGVLFHGVDAECSSEWITGETTISTICPACIIIEAAYTGEMHFVNPADLTTRLEAELQVETEAEARAEAQAEVTAEAESAEPPAGDFALEAEPMMLNGNGTSSSDEAELQNGDGQTQPVTDGVHTGSDADTEDDNDSDKTISADPSSSEN